MHPRLNHCYRLLCSIVFCLLAVGPLKANHNSQNQGEIFYRWAPTSTDSSRYEIFVNWFWDPVSSNSYYPSQTVCISSGCFPTFTDTLSLIPPPPNLRSFYEPNGWRIDADDDCADANSSFLSPDVILKYSGFVSLPGKCGDFVFSVSVECCRDFSSNIVSGENIYLEAKLNNLLREGSSAQIVANPIIALCIGDSTGLPYQFVMNAIEPDGDSMVYRLKQPQSRDIICGLPSDITFEPGYTATAPIPSHSGFFFNSATGAFTLNPSEAGLFTLKMEVESWIFDPISLQWLRMSTCERDVRIPITANCSDQARQSPSIQSSIGGAYQSSAWNLYQVDSIQQAYGVADFWRDSTGGVILPIYQNYQCFEQLIPLEFETPIRCSSIDPTDFRIIGPDSVAVPVTAVIDSCQNFTSSKIYLSLHHSLVRNGNYLLQFKRGNDGNVLIGKCGVEIPEFKSLLIRVAGCPEPSYQLNQVTLRDDKNLMVHWTASPELQDSSVHDAFTAWNVYMRKNQGPWQLQSKILNPLARRYEMDFGGSRYPVDHDNYEFRLELDFARILWGKTRSCENILLEIVNTQSNSTHDEIQLQWNDYDCLPNQKREYHLQYGLYKGGIHLNWSPAQIVHVNSGTVRIPKTAGSGQYAIRVFARDRNAILLPSESNWVMHNININPNQFGGGQTSWIIPKLISPNGDGRNDRFFFIIPPADAGVQQISLRIYNRDGALQFEDLSYQNKNNPNTGWDGVDMNGNDLSAGTYFYLIEYTDPRNGQLKSIPGSINVVR